MQNQNNNSTEEQLQRGTRIKQFMKYACMLWIAGLACITLCRFTEKHSFVNTVLLSITVIAVIAGTSFAMGAVFLRLPNNK